MSPKTSGSSGHIPVVDVDQAFPTLVGGTVGSAAAAPNDLGPAVRAAIRDVLGVRSREEDPKAFTDALTAAFRLVRVEGHIESQFVPRGYAVQADLGAVTGGQASLYRRAMIARTEILRILDGLTPLRVDGDTDDMDAYRTIVRNAVQSLVDEIGAPGGPRIGMVDAYFTGLIGAGNGQTPDTIGGQLGALRDRFGLIDDNVNTIEEEGLRTAYWTLVDMVRDLNDAWDAQRVHFGGGDGAGFLGTELILLSRLMEAASDQVDELEHVLDSVLIPRSERQTIRLHDDTNLTLDGLLSWLRAFLSDEGRRLAQDAGRDGIVSALAPTAVALAETFKRCLADPIVPDDPREGRLPIRYLRAGCCRSWPPGMRAARVAIAVSSLGRLLMDLARRAQRIGRWAGVVVIDVAASVVTNRIDDEQGSTAMHVEFRGLNMRPSYIPAFVNRRARERGQDRYHAEALATGDLILPMDLSATADEESVSALFRSEALEEIFAEAGIKVGTEGVILPAADVPIAIVDVETGQVVHAPWPTTWPRLTRSDRPIPVVDHRRESPNGDGPAPFVSDYPVRASVGSDLDGHDPDGDELPAPRFPGGTEQIDAAVRSFEAARAAMLESLVQTRLRSSELAESAKTQQVVLNRAARRQKELLEQIDDVRGELAKPNLRKPKQDELQDRLDQLEKERAEVEDTIGKLKDAESRTRTAASEALVQADAMQTALNEGFRVDQLAEHRKTMAAAMTGKEQ